MSSRNKELPADRVDRPETDCGLELYRGVGGCSSRSLPLVLCEGGFSDTDGVAFLPCCWCGGVLLDGGADFSVLK